MATEVEQLPVSQYFSDDLSSFAESIYTVSSSSTTWGPGALSGKALKAFGETSLDFLCGVIIRRRLALIRQTLERTPRVFTNPSSGNEWRQRDASYTNLDELCRGDYALSLRRAAANLVKDIVSLISRYLAKSFFDVFEFSPNPKRLTSLFSTPKHIQWASLLSHVLRHEPLFFADQGPSISVTRWSPETLNEESVEDEVIIRPEALDPPGGDLASPTVAVTVEVTPIIAVTVEVTQSQEINEESRMTNALGIRTWLSKTIQSRNQQDRNSKQTAPPTDRPTVDQSGPSMGSESKVLVLGAGGVGKSTLIKQQEWAIPGKPLWHRPQVAGEIIIINTIASMKSLLLNIPSSDVHHSLLEAKRYILDLPLPSYDVECFSPKQLLTTGRMIRSLWRDPEIQKAAQRQRALLNDDLFVAPDSLEYLCDSVDRIFADNYQPSLHDTFRSRVCTTGVHETVLESKTCALRFIDTGGERSERRKWVHCFKDVTAVLFVVALSDYNRFFYDDITSRVNRMDDSLALFDAIVNSFRFADALIILIFNKGDVFAKEIENVPLSQWMPDYNGKTYDDACKHIEGRFIELVKDKKRALRIHYTTAVDEKAMMGKSIIIRDQITRHHQQQQLDKRGYTVHY